MEELDGRDKQLMIVGFHLSVISKFYLIKVYLSKNTSNMAQPTMPSNSDGKSNHLRTNESLETNEPESNENGGAMMGNDGKLTNFAKENLTGVKNVVKTHVVEVSGFVARNKGRIKDHIASVPGDVDSI